MTEPAIAIDARLVAGASTGDSTYWTSLIQAFLRQSSDARLLLFSNASRPEIIPETRTISWIQVSARSSRWWSYVSFPLAARRHRANVVHTQYSLSPLVTRGGVTTVHDVSFLIGPEWFKPRDRAILSRTVPASCRRASRIIAVSEKCRQEIERFIPTAAGKTRVVCNACPDWIHRVPPESAREIVRQKTGVTEPYMLTVGTRWPRKNMALALDAAALLPAQIPHRLVVTGKPGWGEERLGERGVAVGYVDTDTLSALYSAADLYLAPSRHEGFGIPVLEAFRCGCPVLCSSGGALPEVAGDAAVVATSWEPADWAESIRLLLGDPSKIEDLKKRGTERERSFTWDLAARQTLDVYREAAR